MSSLVQRNNEGLNETEWLEMSDGLGMAPASIWTVDDEDDEITLQGKRIAIPNEQPTLDTFDERSERNAPDPFEDDCKRPIRVLDESQVLPGEASFATVRLNQPIELVDIDQRERSAKRNDPPEGDVKRPVRVLDESYVLPGEASFATVRLNQPIESIESNGQERIAKRNPRFEVEVDRPVRVLDESYVPPSEASFATVALNDRNHARSHSPLTEFFAKSNLKIFGAIALSLFSVSAVATLAVLKFKNDVGSSAPMVSNPHQVSLPAASQEKTAVSDSESLEPTGVSQNQSEISSPVASTLGDPAKFGEDFEVADKTLPNPSHSDEAPKKVSGKAVNSSDANVKPNLPKARLVVHAQKEKPGIPQRQSQAKHVSRNEKAVTVKKKNSSSSRAGTVATGEPASLKESATRSNDEIISPPATGGGQRPRTVTRRNP